MINSLPEMVYIEYFAPYFKPLGARFEHNHPSIQDYHIYLWYQSEKNLIRELYDFDYERFLSYESYSERLKEKFDWKI